MKTKLFVLFCLLCLNLLKSEYISKYGDEILSKVDLIVKGQPLKTVRLPKGGGKMIIFKVDSIYYGELKTKQNIYILYLNSFDLKKEDWVVFLQKQESKSIFRGFLEFPLKNKNGKLRLNYLKKVLTIEQITNKDKKSREYIKFCIRSLTSQVKWIGFRGIQELEYLSKKNQSLLNEFLLDKLQAAYNNIPQTGVRHKLSKIIIKIKKRLNKHEKKQRFVKITNGKIIFEKMLTASNIIKQNHNLQTKIKALNTLGLFACEISKNALMEALNDSSANVRSLAIFYIGQNEYLEATDKLIKILQTDPFLRVRKNAIIALTKLRAIQAVPLIKKYVKFKYTKSAAERAIKILQKLAEN